MRRVMSIRGIREGFRAAIAITVLCAAAPLEAALEPGRIYVGGEVLSDEQSGLRLTMPKGWKGQLSPDGESFRLVPDDQQAVLVVIADELSEADARAQMAADVDLGDGVVLEPAGEVVDVATGHLSGAFEVKGAQYDGTIDVRLMQSGLGVVFILLTEPEATEEKRQVMREFAFSLGVTEVERTSTASGTGSHSDDAWQPYLKGRYLARYYTSSGYTESTELWLCSDGSFRYSSQGGGFGGGASGAAAGSGGGRWSATGAGQKGQLLLMWASGGRTTIELGYDYEKNRLYLDGKRYLRGKNEVCW